MIRALEDTRSGALTVRAAAKINLHLGVGAPREDGFHPLDTVYHAVSLYDDVSVAPAPEWTVETALAAYLEGVELPGPGENIVDAVGRLLDPTGDRAAAVRIGKSIPVAGGMAGGSADAAAAMVALDRLWDLRTPDDELLRLAAELGSDVPFALLGGTARGQGRGELVTPVADHGDYAWVLVPSERGLSTPEVYRRFDALFPDASPEPPSPTRVLEALSYGDTGRLAIALRNDLEPAALDLRPDLVGVLERGEAEGALRGIVSGSGPTCAFLCESHESAQTVADAMTGAGQLALLALGPVAGAHVVEVL
ncbi:4-(cytidine 5'-diphospho)-2-C-methyl-D-erythritol kinase [Nocardioides campestrisoli]|uniref:4-(cytidine 5'-diphospho)-2-C-methyl-D-erythritol kinase n=1 Tax=Nocardioides campestrisoli TaxID=2736757 RepID=UPI0028112997|nr:4-(cytidine 5'-diphospho)-2-C-methyl-D-erythritol kinase [Nocardioides campestrisoli]